MGLTLLSTGLVYDLDPKAGLRVALKQLRPITCEESSSHTRCILQKTSTETPRPLEYMCKLFISPFMNRNSEGVNEVVEALHKTVPAKSRFIAALGHEFSECDDLSQSDLELLAALFSGSKQDSAPRDIQAGVADLSAPRLSQLLEYLGADLPVSIDLINATECCALPPDILALAQQKKIQLLAHHDPATLFASSEIQETADAIGIPLEKWAFLLRIVASDAERQVLVGTEYIVGSYSDA